MKPILVSLLITCTLAGSLVADDWDPNDDTFDPTIHSVVIGDRSWLGDPSPFEDRGLSRTGYTHVNTTHYQGLPPAVQVSLIVPLAAGETESAGGMLLLDQAQTAKLIEVLKHSLQDSKAESRQEKDDQENQPTRVPIKTSLQGADWALVEISDKGQRLLEWESKADGKTSKYRFSINASKKLLGAIQHSFDQLESEVK